MIKKQLFNERFLMKKLPIAFCYLLSVSAMAQNTDDILQIQKYNHLQDLTAIGKKFRKNTFSVAQLKRRANRLNMPFSGEAEGRFFQLQGFTNKGKPQYYITYNRDAAAETGVTKLQSNENIFNLEGEGIKIYEWDGGKIRASHTEFGDRAKQGDVPTSVSRHATHVAGTMIASGIDSKAKGMAPKATLEAYDWTSDQDEMIAAIKNGALVSNHSYGFLGGFEYGNYSGFSAWHWFGEDEDTEYVGFGHYGDTDSAWDLISYNAPYFLPIKAAGNPRGDGPKEGDTHYVQVKEDGKEVWVKSTKVRQKNGGEFGYDCINTGSVGKNILVVAAANKILDGYEKPEDVVAASFSAFGPTDDGRIKPDITGIGVDVYSTNSTGDTNYEAMSGTSMASPNVTGALSLLQEYYKKIYGNTSSPAFMKSATLKALAIHTANEAGKYDGPDYQFGWGLLNAYKGAETIFLKDKYALIKEEKIENTKEYTQSVKAMGTEPLKVTIVWEDPVVDKDHMPAETLNNRQKVLVNDLDLRITDDSGNVYFPWVLDPEHPANPAQKADNVRDNVEQVVIPNAVAGKTYTIKVTHKSPLKTNKVDTSGKVSLIDSESQNFSLIATGINNGITKDLAISAVQIPSPTEYSSNTPVKVVIDNKASENISGAVLRYKFYEKNNPNNATSGEQKLSDVNVGQSIQADINLDLSKSFVDYVLETQIEVDGDVITLNDRQVKNIYGVVADLTKKGSSFSFDFESDFPKNSWKSESLDFNGKTWVQYDDKSYARSGTKFATNFPNVSTADDWLYSNPIKVKGGEPYILSFYTRKFQDREEKISIRFGKEPIHTSMTDSINDNVEVFSIRDYKKYNYEFTPTEDGIIYLGFNHKSADRELSYAVSIDDFSVYKAEDVAIVDFSIDKEKANSYEVVSLTNETYAPKTTIEPQYKWFFEPNTVTFTEGDETSKNPKVIFNEEGTYSVQLIAKTASGEYQLKKSDIIRIANREVRASFKPSSDKIFEGEIVTMENTSKGNPEPNKFEWTITPSEGVEYVNNTTSTSKNPEIRFNHYGEFSIDMKATSPHSSENVQSKIIVQGIHEAVRNLNASQENKNVKLTWNRPTLQNIYEEDFEASPNLYTIDVNNDGRTWYVGRNPRNDKGGRNVLISKSWQHEALNVDDWFITPKLHQGAEILSYNIFSPYKERYDIYIVPADGDTQPNVDTIKKGIKIEAVEDAKTSGFETKTIDIKPHTSKDFYVAFHHRTTKEDDGLHLILDDIKVGYNNEVASGQPAQSIVSGEKTKAELAKEAVQKGRIITSEELKEAFENYSTNNNVKSYGITEFPHLVGYEVYKNKVKLANIDDINQLTHLDNIDKNGIYTYDVYALYSDNVKSEKRTIEVRVVNLSTQEVGKNGFRIYEINNSQFVIKSETNKTHLSAEVYDLSGKLIQTNTFKINEAVLNLSLLPKGTYLLNILDNEGNKYSQKVIVK